MASDIASALLILPGIHGSGDMHWQTAWERQLSGARRVSVADWDRPECDAWVEALERAVCDVGSEVVVVAHSLGCLQLAHWAARSARRVRAAMLVAPPDPDAAAFPAVARGFTPLPRQPFRFASTLVASTNDPYATPGFARACAEVWGSRLVELGPLGHINVDSGIGDWREGQQILRDMLREEERKVVPVRP